MLQYDSYYFCDNSHNINRESEPTLCRAILTHAILTHATVCFVFWATSLLLHLLRQVNNHLIAPDFLFQDKGCVTVFRYTHYIIDSVYRQVYSILNAYNDWNSVFNVCKSYICTVRLNNGARLFLPNSQWVTRNYSLVSDQ